MRREIPNPYLVLDNVAASRTYGTGKGGQFVNLGPITMAFGRGEAVGIVGHRKDGVDLLVDLLVSTSQSHEGRIYSRGDVVFLGSANDFDPDATLHFNLSTMGMAYRLSGRHLKSLISIVADQAGVGDMLGFPVSSLDDEVLQRARIHMALSLARPVTVIYPVSAMATALIDEVILEHIYTYLAEGGSLVMVNQEMPALMKIPSTVYWLEDGQLVGQGPPPKIRRVRTELERARTSRESAKIERLIRNRDIELSVQRLLVVNGASGNE